MDNESSVRRYSRLLQRHGFSDTYASGMRSTFDIIARKRDRVVILKLVDNIDSLGKAEAESLKKLNDFFDADVYVVFRTYKGAPARKEMLFTRHGVDCVSQDTLESVLNEKRLPRAEKFLGRKYRIDANELKRLRKLQDLSMRGLSSTVKISKDTIYRYERGGAFATEPTLKKMQSLFKTNMVEMPGEPKRPDVSYEYHKINRDLDVKFIDLGSSPFYMLGKRHYRYEIGIEMDNRTMKKLVTFYKGFSSVLSEDYPFIIAKGKAKENIYGIPVLSKKELESIVDEKDLIDTLASRKKN